MNKIINKIRIITSPRVQASVLSSRIKESLDSIGICLDLEISRYDKWRNSRGIKKYNITNDSIHPLVLAGLLNQRKSKVNFLEFGTYIGENTAYLADSFLNVSIDTIDLPSFDPLLRGMYDRHRNDKFDEFKKLQEKNVSHKNIQFYEFNTLFFGSSDLSKKRYDVIWLDAGHNFPEIAWDFANALSVLKKGGYLVIDDVITDIEEYVNPYVSTHSNSLIGYLNERKNIEIAKILKRADSNRYKDPRKRKYVVTIKVL